ncbi:MAG: S41 family peptidase [Gammaproteobacteria bacterium]
MLKPNASPAGVVLAILLIACAPGLAYAEDAIPGADVPAHADDAGDASAGDDGADSSAGDTDAAAATPTDTREPVPVDDIRVLVEVFHKIKKDYVEAVDDKTLIENAMRGMLAGLDPHSAYLDPEEYLDLQEGTSGEFGGLGIEVGMEDGFVKVIAPIDGTPAQEAGIQAGDVIVRLDDTPVKGMNLNDAVQKMRGKPGTDIRLTVVREGEEKPLTFTITRALVKVRSVRSRMLEPGYGYIRISQFQGPTGDDLRRHLRDLKSEAGDDGLRGLVLDLRNNPGGILGAAVSVADAFLESGLVVYTDGRIKDSELEFTAKPPDLLRGAPLIVLVNEGSASASEIVAGALQDQKRALIMGRQTFGKGSVQTILPMNNRAALKLTTARYFTPSGRSIQAEGIAPDIVVDKLKLAARAAGGADVVKEANLERHLVNPEDAIEVDVEGADDSVTDATDDVEQPLAERDYELYEALNMLKGMTLLQARSGSNAGAADR